MFLYHIFRCPFPFFLSPQCIYNAHGMAKVESGQTEFYGIHAPQDFIPLLPCIR